MITFKTDTELTLVTEFDKNFDNISGEETVLFEADELVDGDIIEEEGDYVTLQFGDGSVAFSVQRDCFNVM